MADNLNLDVVFRLAVEGAGGASSELQNVANAANQAGQLSDRGWEQVQRGAVQAGAATRNAANDMRSAEANASTLRYANYDLAQTMFTLSAAITAVGASTLVAFASQESAFTEVERILATNGESVGALRGELLDLSTEIPIAFQDLSAIAGLGAALDIASDDLDEFTSTVGRFAAVTGTSMDEAGEGIARIAQYTGVGAQGFENLGSAILTAGNISIATEQEVLRYSQSIALAGSQAGFSAEQIIGLGAATASFARINVEGAGSAFARVTQNIERAVSSGGETLEAFARISGQTVESFRSQWQSDAGSAFNRVIEGLNDDLPNLIQNMDALGIRNVRDRRVVQALAQQWEAVAPILERTSDAFKEGASLSQAYSYIMDDLSSRFQIFLNSATNAASALGGLMAPAAIAALDAASQLLSVLEALAANPIGSFALQAAAGMAGLVAAVAALRGGLALATASTIAYRQAVQSTVAANGGMIGQLQLLTAQFGRVGGAAATAGGAVSGFGAAGAVGRIGGLAGALRGVIGLLGGPWVLAIGAAIGGIVALGSSIEAVKVQTEKDFKNTLLETDNVMYTLRKTMQDAGIDTSILSMSFSEMRNVLDRTAPSATEAGTSLEEVSKAAGDAREIAQFAAHLETLGKTLADTASTDLPAAQKMLRRLRDELGATSGDLPQLLELLGPRFRKAIEDQLSAAGLATTEQNVLAAAFGDTGINARLAEGGIQGLKTEEQSLQEKTEELTKELQTLRDELLNIAGSSKDALSAQNDLDSSFGNLASSIEDWGGAIDSADPKAAALRDSILRVADANLAMVDTNLKNGDSADEAFGKWDAARGFLLDMITPYFESRDAAEIWANDTLGSAEEVRGAIDDTKRQMDELDGATATTEVKTDTSESDQKMSAAEQRLDRWNESEGTSSVFADGSGANNTLGDVERRLGLWDRSSGTSSAHTDGSSANQDLGYLEGRLHNWDWSQGTAKADVDGSQAVSNMLYISNELRKLDGQSASTYVDNFVRTHYIYNYLEEYNDSQGPGRGFKPGELYTGGFTGRGGKYEPAGIVHRGEYVIPKHQVNQATGLPYADALGKLTKGANPTGNYARGGFVQPMTQNGPIDLSASTIQRVAQAIRSDVYIDTERITRSVNAQNTRRTERGAR